MNKAVLITGGSGFVGKHFCDFLVADGYKVFNVGRQSQNLSLGVESLLIASDITERIRETVEKNGITHCIHLAGCINGSSTELQNANEDFTALMLNALSPFQETLRFIYVSSVSAAGPLGAYGAAKRHCETLIENAQFKHWLILRPSLLYGEYDTKNVAALIRMVKNFPLVPVPGGKHVKLQPLHVEDLYNAIRTYIERSPAANRIYTVAGPQQEPLLAMLAAIKNQLQRRTLLLSIPLKPIQLVLPLLAKLLPFARLPVQQVSSLHSHPPWDSSKASEDLNFKPRYFSEGIRQVLS